MQKIDGISQAVSLKSTTSANADVSNQAQSASDSVQSAEGIAPAVAETSAAAPTQEATVPEPVSSEALDAALEQIREQAQRVAPQLKFENDSESDVVVIKVIDRVTGEIIRQLPPEAVVDAQSKGLDGLPTLIADFA